MPYIPEAHQKYAVLPWKRKHGGEVFEYTNWDHLEPYIPREESLEPYGVKSYEEYDSILDCCVKANSQNEAVVKLFEDFRATMKRLNHKEDWSILRYTGSRIGEIDGLVPGHVYYWPCDKTNPVYRGVIDEAEYTAYWFPTEETDWEILEDPTGMAYRTIHEKGKGHVTRESFEKVMSQLKSMEGK